MLRPESLLRSGPGATGLVVWSCFVMLGLIGETRAQEGATALPDSVLATVNGDRQVTVSGFRDAWDRLEPPQRPDSLTPQSARRFLDLLIGKEALGAAALTESWNWTTKDSAEYGGLRDQLIMKVVLDSALTDARDAARARGLDSLTMADLGTFAREQSIEKLGVTYDDALLERLAAAFAAVPKPPRDSGIFAAMRALGRNPEVDPNDLPKVVARWSGDTFTAGDLMNYWRSLNPLSRPRVELPRQVRDLVDNGIFERELRRSAKERGIEFWPDIAAQLHEKHEYIAVQHLVEREVYERIPLDSLTLVQYYRDNERAWDLPPRARVLRLVLPDREQADAMRMRLTDSTKVAELAKEASEAGVSYEEMYTSAIDSVMFDRAVEAGRGGIFGPDKVDDGWAVTRVQEVLPGRPRPYAEVVELVRHAVYGKKGEELMQELLKRCIAEADVLINERALEAVGGG